MTPNTPEVRARRSWQLASLWACMATVIAGCSSPRPPAPPPAPVVQAPAPVAPAPVAQIPAPTYVSHATSVHDYRPDAANHLYKNNGDRIYAGKMPPLLHAVGVLETDIDARGNVIAVRWMRAPEHAPEVMAEIVRTVRQASPFPAPTRLGRVTYTDTWLWHKSGRFQLHTLSEGQF